MCELRLGGVDYQNPGWITKNFLMGWLIMKSPAKYCGRNEVYGVAGKAQPLKVLTTPRA